MAKTKITKSKIPILKRDLEIDDEVLKKLSIEQNRVKTRIKDRLEVAKSESLKRYNAKIESLTKTRTETVKAFDEDIKKYKSLVTDLKGIGNVPVTKVPAKKARVTKVTTRRTSDKKK